MEVPEGGLTEFSEPPPSGLLAREGSRGASRRFTVRLRARSSLLASKLLLFLFFFFSLLLPPSSLASVLVVCFRVLDCLSSFGAGGGAGVWAAGRRGADVEDGKILKSCEMLNLEIVQVRVMSLCNAKCLSSKQTVAPHDTGLTARAWRRARTTGARGYRGSRGAPSSPAAAGRMERGRSPGRA